MLEALGNGCEDRPAAYGESGASLTTKASRNCRVYVAAGFLVPVRTMRMVCSPGASPVRSNTTRLYWVEAL